MCPNAICNIERNGGFGLAVIGKLKETKVKNNLYYELKDKVIEETLQDGRIIKKSKRVKVFGLYSDRETRNMLIEILRDRMSLHKDKFISPTIYKELTGLEVKKNGKVEHSDLTHDDQIFSYLMAMYVWYEGKNLKENFNIEKTTIKTEESIDDVVDMETGPNSKSFADITKGIAEANTNNDDINKMKLNMDLLQMQKNKGMLLSEFMTKEKKKEEQHLSLLLREKQNKEAYARYYGIPVEAVDTNIANADFNSNASFLPNSLFTDFNKTNEELQQDSIYLTIPQEDREYSRNMTIQEDDSLQ